MRRKVIQEYVNFFCQKVIDLPEGYDLASFAHYGSGIYRADILTGSCSYNGNPIPQLRLCDEYRHWMKKQLERHRIQGSDIMEATILIKVKMKGLNTRAPYGHRFASGHFSFECESEIKTDEKSYVGQMQGEKAWGFDWYYEQLYGSLPDAWPSTP
ncbi:MAG TPA: hypothetical protein VN776_00270 [Terracidiphilus sp.]|nr:hypothetical protein [Terracidiphilus sp.]